MKNILVVGTSARGALERSYLNSLERKCEKTDFFDYRKEMQPFIKGKRFGQIFHEFIPVEQWIRKMNRKLIVHIKNTAPEVIFIFAKAKILYGTLACIKTILPKTKIVWIWPDTPMNLEQVNLNNSSLVDLFCTYSSSTLKIFEKLGYQNVLFCPLAADLNMAISDKQENFKIDIGFVGGWRPERQKTLEILYEQYKELKFEIHGPYWKKELKSHPLSQYVKSDGLYENELYTFFNSTRININVIDDTNYPAANMRFFEIPISNSLQLSSECPEMETVYKHMDTVCYFNSKDDLLQITDYILGNPDEAADIRNRAFQNTIRNHTYDHRIEEIINRLSTMQ